MTRERKQAERDKSERLINEMVSCNLLTHFYERTHSLPPPPTTTTTIYLPQSSTNCCEIASRYMGPTIRSLPTLRRKLEQQPRIYREGSSSQVKKNTLTNVAMQKPATHFHTSQRESRLSSPLRTWIKLFLLL